MECFVTYHRYLNTYLCETILETDLHLGNIYSFFSAVVSHNVFVSRHGVFVCLKRNKGFLGSLPHLTPTLERLLFDSGLCLSRTGEKSLLRIFREKRNIFITSLYGESILVTRDDILSLLKVKITTELKEGKLVKRYVDSDILLALCLVNSVQTGKKALKNDSACEKNKQKKDFFNDSKNKNLKPKGIGGHNERSTLSPVVPRRPHTTTLVDFEIVAFPNDGQKYNHSNYPKSKDESENNFTEEKYPTQVTEVDAGQPSFEHHRRSIASSLITGENTWIAQESVYSTPPFSYHRRTTDSGNAIASGNGIPFYSKPAKYPDYTEQHKRENSFYTPKWPRHDKPDHFLLAHSGFFFTGNTDLVRCYHCGIGLKDWDKDDDVLNEHVKHSSSCDYIIHTFGKVKIERMKLALTAGINNGIDANSSQLPYKIRSPRYQTMEARLASFKNFPRLVNLTPQQLAVAGLFFTGKGDLCRCFTCDGGLKDWSPGDDPIKEHATYFPNCAYINQLKGPNYVELQQKSRQRNEPVGAACGSGIITQPTNIPMDQLTLADTGNEYSSFNITQVVQQLGYAEIDVITAKAELETKGNKSPTAEDIVNTLLDMQERTSNFKTVAALQDSEKDLQALSAENKELSRLIYCMLCITGEADILFLPCNHHRTCHECAADLIFCPVCNEFIKEKVKTFRS